MDASPGSARGGRGCGCRSGRGGVGGDVHRHPQLPAEGLHVGHGRADGDGLGLDAHFARSDRGQGDAALEPHRDLDGGGERAEGIEPLPSELLDQVLHHEGAHAVDVHAAGVDGDDLDGAAQHAGDGIQGHHVEAAEHRHLGVAFRVRSIGEAGLAVQAHEAEAVIEMHLRARDADAVAVEDHLLEGQGGGDDLPDEAFVRDHEHLVEGQERPAARGGRQRGQALAPSFEHGLIRARRRLAAARGKKEGGGEGDPSDGA